ncbi:MAG: hypothetical protein M1818_000148 [Claussenomyces sp. TS43310]|nr:MAG: hypothetical protein M1818_000148 [Claussenomyces sp. TS43310]
MAKLACPFCSHETGSEYEIMYHLEYFHPEGETPFMGEGYPSEQALPSGTMMEILAAQSAVEYSECPITGCGEAILSSELDGHLDMHSLEDSDTRLTHSGHSQSTKQLRAEDSASHLESTLDLHSVAKTEDTNALPKEFAPNSGSDRHEGAKASWRAILNMPAKSLLNHKSAEATEPFRRLGKAELGPHANEREMPSWLRNLLEERDGEVKGVNRLDQGAMPRRINISNHAHGILPVLAQLLCQDFDSAYAYLCSPCVLHISKLWREGGFCGYRNIQMMASYIIGVNSQGHQHFYGKVPTIFDIQEFIECAWDMGINAHGRLETGGVRGTRKYIGTPEAQAVFTSLDISCNAQAVKSKGDQSAHRLLCEVVEHYFVSGCVDNDKKVRETNLPPLYFQHRGHSMTIIGFEKQRNGAVNLLVFDPMFRDASAVTKLVDQTFKHKNPASPLRAYRRGSKYLAKYKEFEILSINANVTSLTKLGLLYTIEAPALS